MANEYIDKPKGWHRWQAVTCIAVALGFYTGRKWPKFEELSDAESDAYSGQCGANYMLAVVGEKLEEVRRKVLKSPVFKAAFEDALFVGEFDYEVSEIVGEKIRVGGYGCDVREMIVTLVAQFYGKQPVRGHRRGNPDNYRIVYELAGKLLSDFDPFKEL